MYNIKGSCRCNLVKDSLSVLICSFFFFFSGVIPHIHKSLIGKKGANKPT